MYGVGPNMGRNAVFNTGELVAYDTTRQLIRNYTSFNSENPIFYVLYGMAAGFTGMMTAMPFDVIKTRMMNEGEKYGTPLNCAKELLKNDGPLGFYKGIKPGLARAMSFNVVFFFSLGWARKFINKKYEVPE